MQTYYPVSDETRRAYDFVLTSPFGLRKGTTFHQGCDYSVRRKADGIRIIASQDGILFNDVDRNGGKYCYIHGVDGRGYLTVHHNHFLLPSGVRVKAGQDIAIMGWSGHVIPSGMAGMHVHFEIRADFRHSNSYIDPEKQNLIYYQKIMPGSVTPWENVNKWNDDIGVGKTDDDKPYTTENIDISFDDSKPSKLSNKIDSEHKKQLLTKLYDLNNFMEVNGAQDDEIVKRFLGYRIRSNKR